MLLNLSPGCFVTRWPTKFWSKSQPNKGDFDMALTSSLSVTLGIDLFSDFLLSSNTLSVDAKYRQPDQPLRESSGD